MKPNERFIVALDILDFERIKSLVDSLDDLCKIFKVGPSLFLRYGKEIIDFLKKREKSIFLDLKLNDIPNSIGCAVKEASDMGIDMLTIHTLGGREMLECAVSSRKGNLPLLLGVTILTSLDKNWFSYMRIDFTIDEMVSYLSLMAKEADFDGVIASAMEIREIKDTCGKDFLVVVPGIRLFESLDDQKRKATPKEAISSGADYIVVGRPITNAENPREIVRKITESLVY
ncbi:MAG: orotidine-5'-phosphate decarboxylase [bacterium]